jgi:hypothetical protein
MHISHFQLFGKGFAEFKFQGVVRKSSKRRLGWFDTSSSGSHHSYWAVLSTITVAKKPAVKAVRTPFCVASRTAFRTTETLNCAFTGTKAREALAGV